MTLETNGWPRFGIDYEVGGVLVCDDEADARRELRMQRYYMSQQPKTAFIHELYAGATLVRRDSNAADWVPIPEEVDE